MNKKLSSYCLAAAVALAITTPTVLADEHEEEDLGLSLLSIYGYAPGTAPADLEAGMVEYQKEQEKLGFDDCGLYRHEFGDTRGVYTYCNFKDMEQFGKIMDKQPSEPVTEPQLFGQHSDHIVAVTKRNMEKAPPYVIFSHWTFSSDLSLAETGHYSEKLFDMFDEAFGGCNAYSHKWGPELGLYLSCGFDNYADFAKKDAMLGEMFDDDVMYESMHVTSHSDEILKLVMD